MVRVAILVVRAAAGLLDSALRESGIDVIFLTGGVLFGLSAPAFRRVRTRMTDGQ